MSSDPLTNAPPSRRALFDRFSDAASGFPADHVIDAAANIIINALRQAHPMRLSAGADFDEIFGKMKSILMEHYDSTGRKKGIFPYDQTISAEHFIDPNGFFKTGG